MSNRITFEEAKAAAEKHGLTLTPGVTYHPFTRQACLLGACAIGRLGRASEDHWGFHQTFKSLGLEDDYAHGVAGGFDGTQQFSSEPLYIEGYKLGSEARAALGFNE